MKLVYTIRQMTKTVLPDLFLNRVLPVLRRKHEVKAFLIQHKANISNHPAIQEAMDRVAEKTKQNVYRNAEIIEHEEVYEKYPSLPSFRIAFETSAKENADYHFFLEDDSIIIDNSDGWTLDGFNIGSYRPDFIRTAYGVCRNTYSSVILANLNLDRLDIQAPLVNHVSQVVMGEGAKVILGKRYSSARLEGWLTNLCCNQYAKLPPALAGRFHMLNTPIIRLLNILNVLGVSYNALDEDFPNWRSLL